ncbi:hypothetical protein GCM10023094_12500 [Rhodococcus olei]|uniref:Uncharacterized protein n=1 Tax=Rhodococcus olei TaxID=2161675 RepID=A0ABP8NYN2_9NOCA
MVTFTIEAHEDTPATELDLRAENEWDRLFAASDHAGRVRIPRPVSSHPHPSSERVVVHTYEAVMWDAPAEPLDRIHTARRSQDSWSGGEEALSIRVGGGRHRM